MQELPNFANMHPDPTHPCTQVALSNGYEGWALVADELQPFEGIKEWAEKRGILLAGPYKGSFASAA